MEFEKLHRCAALLYLIPEHCTHQMAAGMSWLPFEEGARKSRAVDASVAIFKLRESTFLRHLEQKAPVTDLLIVDLKCCLHIDCRQFVAVSLFRQV